jgi:hypothetical protein
MNLHKRNYWENVDKIETFKYFHADSTFILFALSAERLHSPVKLMLNVLYGNQYIFTRKSVYPY